MATPTPREAELPYRNPFARIHRADTAALSSKVSDMEAAKIASMRHEVTRESDKIELAEYDNIFPNFFHSRESSTSSASGDDVFHSISADMPELRDLSREARKATRAEQKLTLLSAWRRYPKAIAWSILLSSTIIMEGYDTVLIYSFFSYPDFVQKYGGASQQGQQPHQISAAWQSGLVMGATVGEIFGLFINGYLTDRYGYHRTMVGALCCLCLAVFVAFFAVNIQMLLVAEILCGIPWGIFQTLSTTYAAEVMPVALRAYLLSNINMCWVIGQIVGAGILRGFADIDSQWSFRIPFALQWGLVIPILIAILFAPESPWWLIQHDKPERARGALLRLTTASEDSSFNVDETISMMKHTNEVEKRFGTGGMSYLDCFKGTDLRRTEIACMVWIVQRLCGSTFTTYAAYFYEQAGLAADASFNLQLGMYGLAITGGVIAWFLLASVGRRPLYIWGLVGSFVILLATGVISSLPDFSAEPLVVGSMIIVLTLVYDLTVGPVCYVLVAEIPSTRLRVKTVVIARVVYNLVGVVVSILTPYMINPLSWNWKGKACYFYAGTSLLCLIWCYFRLPESFGLSYLEIDILFQKRAKISKWLEVQGRLARSGYFNLSNYEREASVW